MFSHAKTILVLLIASLLLCSILYPLVVFAAGQTLFPFQASGSLLAGPDGKPIGSRQIAQPFSGDGYFQPRPSAVSYNAAASGGSNWGANNIKLRDRAARIIGPIARYAAGTKAGELVGPDIEQWFSENPDLLSRWEHAHPTLAARASGTRARCRDTPPR